MEVNFNQMFVSHRQQAVAGDIGLNVRVDLILVQPLTFHQQLGVVSIFQHSFASFYSSV